MSFDILPGTPGLPLAEVVHVLIPGRGRNGTGDGLTAEGAARVHTAAELHRAVLATRGGRIICSGYKSPADRKGRPWATPQAPGEFFQGVPEADLMRRELLSLGIPAAAVRVERHSVDTVTNLLRAEAGNHFGDPRPVAIVSQRAHLHRILTIVAPRTLRRPYLGVVVPETAPEAENPLADLASRLITSYLPGNPARAVQTADRRARTLWRLAQTVGRREYH